MTPNFLPDHTLLVLGDQLHPEHPALARLDPARDEILLIEAPGEARHVWSHPARIAVFLAAMRHAAAHWRAQGWRVHHLALDDPALALAPGLTERLRLHMGSRRPANGGSPKLLALEPGEWRLEQDLRAAADQEGWALTLLPDPHFLCSRAEFTTWAAAKKELRMEYFYRHMRQKHRVLMDADGEPEGGRWNFDEDNRSAYPKTGPGSIPAHASFPPQDHDPITRDVLALVKAQFPDHPGSLAHFAWPVTREQGLRALKVFIETRLTGFGAHQDAMWENTPFGWHSLLSVALNLHLLHPLEVVRAAEQAWRDGRVPLASAEGFIRQVLGWREFIRGVYWRDMPGLATANHLQAHRPLPDFYWTGHTDMACLRDAIGQTLAHGYSHHIQRLMVTGLYALLAEVEPQQVQAWFLAMYVDAIEWVELPNVAGMALYANGGRFTSKPYVASGAYISRMSNHCKGCRYKPAVKTGPQACPFTTLYWNFLDRHERALAGSPRTALMVKNLQRMTEEERAAIRTAAQAWLQGTPSQGLGPGQAPAH